MSGREIAEKIDKYNHGVLVIQIIAGIVLIIVGLSNIETRYLFIIFGILAIIFALFFFYLVAGFEYLVINAAKGEKDDEGEEEN